MTGRIMRRMLLGRVMVQDVAYPRPEDVDVEFMLYRLGTVRRFSGHWSALTVDRHQRLCGRLARAMGYAPAVVEWAEHHDDHEYATGDIPTPMQQGFGIDEIRAVQTRWDVAICGALGIDVPTDEVRRHVAVADAVALAIEWEYLLRQPLDELGLSRDILALVERHYDQIDGLY